MKDSKKKFTFTTEKFLILIIVLYCIVVTCVNPGFFSAATLFDMIKSSAGSMVVAMGLLLVIITGGIDVSFTAVAISSGYIATTIMMNTGINNIFFGFAIAIIIGIVLGLINAVLIHVTKMEPFIITLATQSIFHGCLTTFVGTKNIGSVDIPTAITKFGGARLFTMTDEYGNKTGLSIYILIVIAVVALTWWIMYKTMLGRSVFALGCSAESARRAGFNSWKTHLFVYAYIGMLGAIYGMLSIGGVNACNPVSMVGTELTIIAAVIIGGAKVTGGSGSILGTLLGVFIMYLFNQTLVFLGFSSSWNNLFLGVVLIVSIVITSYQERRKNRRLFIFTE
ncbi:MAG: ABC transporter permease [Lachnospiraceae bacterium]|nr:ABC transporter permease [Candidatus Equihabitans merdae]